MCLMSFDLKTTIFDTEKLTFCAKFVLHNLSFLELRKTRTFKMQTCPSSHKSHHLLFIIYRNIQIYSFHQFPNPVCSHHAKTDCTWQYMFIYTHFFHNLICRRARENLHRHFTRRLISLKIHLSLSSVFAAEESNLFECRPWLAEEPLKSKEEAAAGSEVGRDGF